MLFKTQSFVYVFTVHRKPTAMLRGHNAPIFFLHIADDDDRIYSLSTDRSLKVGSPRQPPQLRFGGEEGAGHDITGTRVLPVLCVSLNKVKWVWHEQPIPAVTVGHEQPVPAVTVGWYNTCKLK